MRLPRDPFDRVAQDAAIADAVTNTASTAMYLDTSAAVWLYRLAEGTRREFISWATGGPRSGKLHVPGWALHELHRHRRSPDKLLPARPIARSILTELEAIKDAAALFADDARARARTFTDRADYLNFLAKATQDMARALGMLKDSVEFASIEEDVLPFLEEASLSLPLPTQAALQQEFLARAEGRMPPGYRDAAKKGDAGDIGGDGANRYGDFVFWKEILQHANSDQEIKKVVIITHDQKDDWVFAPNRYIDYNSRKVSNDRKPKLVTCAHPTLCHEAKAVAGVDELYIVTIPQLIQLLSNTPESRDVQQLARAVQIERQADDRLESASTEPEAAAQEEDDTFDASGGQEADEIIAEPEIVEPVAEPIAQEPAGPETITAKLNSLRPEARADADYLPLGPDQQADQIIAGLKTHDWYRQNPAVAGVGSVVAQGNASHDQIFVLGRNLYQAACGNAWAAAQKLEQLETFLSGLPSPGAETLFAGILFEAYFGSHGEVRSRPKDEYLTSLFVAAEQDRYLDVINWFQAQIAPSRLKFLRLPGDGTQPDIFSVESGNDGITGILLGQMRLTRAVDDPFGLDALGKGMTEHSLAKTLANHFATLPQFVTLRPGIHDPVDLSHLALIEWGAHTDVEFPLREGQL